MAISSCPLPVQSISYFSRRLAIVMDNFIFQRNSVNFRHRDESIQTCFSLRLRLFKARVTWRLKRASLSSLGSRFRLFQSSRFFQSVYDPDLYCLEWRPMRVGQMMLLHHDRALSFSTMCGSCGSEPLLLSKTRQWAVFHCV
jgi:hypothetical protein